MGLLLSRLYVTRAGARPLATYPTKNIIALYSTQWGFWDCTYVRTYTRTYRSVSSLLSRSTATVVPLRSADTVRNALSSRCSTIFFLRRIRKSGLYMQVFWATPGLSQVTDMLMCIRQVASRCHLLPLPPHGVRLVRAHFCGNALFAVRCRENLHVRAVYMPTQNYVQLAPR